MKPKITFKELKVLIAEAAGISRRQVQDLFRETLGVIKFGLLRDGHVTITGIGRFKVKEKAARIGRHPKTGDPIAIPAKKVVQLKPDAGLRRFINRAYAERQSEPLAPPSPLAGERIIPVDFKPPAEPETTAMPATGTVHEPTGTPEAPVPIAAVELPPETPPAHVIDSVPAPSDSSSSDRATTSRGPVIIGGILALLLVIGGLAFMLTRQQALVPPLASTTKAIVNQDGALPKMVASAVEPVKIKAEAPVLKDTEPDKEPPKPNIFRQKIAAVTSAHAAPVMEAKPVALPKLRYSVRAGDSLWRIANRSYDAPYLWPNIYRVNQDLLAHPDMLTVGLPIEVPSLEGSAANLSRTDIENTATGYFNVYQAYRRTDNPHAPFYLWVAYRLDGDRLRDETHAAVDPGDLEFIEGIQGKDLIRQSVAIGFKMLFSSLKMPLIR